MADISRGDAIARRVAEAIIASDNATNAMGMVVEDVGEGWARLSMLVREDMLNGHKTCHGGFIFTLADSAFAFACNGRNQATVAQSCDITFTRPARLGDRLVATCREKQLEGRSGVYDTEVTDAAGAIVALFRGRSRAIRGEIVPGLTAGMEGT